METLFHFCEAPEVDLAEFFSDGARVNPFPITAIKRLTDAQQQGSADFINTFLQ